MQSAEHMEFELGYQVFSLWLESMGEKSDKTWNECFVEWLFSPTGFRKAEPRDKWSQILNRQEGIQRRKLNKLARKKKKLKTNRRNER